MPHPVTELSFKDVCRHWFPGKNQMATHLKLDGGSLCIKDVNNFHLLYANAVHRKESIYMVERKTEPVFRMFFDIDAHLELTQLVDRDWYIKMCKYVAGTLYELFCDNIQEPIRLIVSTADSKIVRKYSKECCKYGIHINVPDLHVTREMALRIRSAVVQKLNNNFPKCKPTAWNNDIDESVYLQNGLRMMYSRKMRKCTCSIKDRDSCEHCLGVGKIDEGRAYTPLMTIYTDFSTDEFVKDGTREQILCVVKDTCLRSELGIPNCEFNHASPNWFEDVNMFSSDSDLTHLTTQKHTHLSRSRLTEGHSTVEARLKNKQDLTACDLASIHEWLHRMVCKRTLPREYKNVYISSAFSFTTNNIRSHVICRLDSQFCMNIGREHVTNTVYLEVNLVTKQAFCKCYCRCDTLEGRRAQVRGKVVRCRDYRSNPISTAELKLSLSCNEQIGRPRVLSIL